VPVLEDKIVQRATVEVFNAIYETDFLGFSYGFRPGRSQDLRRMGVITKGKSRMREIRLSGSVEGVVSNHDPYSDS
jgi:hypothetical protein